MPNSEMTPSTSWGSWSFNAGALTLDLKREGAPVHSIQLRGITSSACMLDIIFELKRKQLADNEVIGDLVTALQDLFDPHVNLCGGGRDRKFDPLSHFESVRIH